jgi:hypothetical protein
MARSRRRADIRDHGFVERIFRRPPGHALSGDARLIADERNDSDVSVDERVPFIALAEADLWAAETTLAVVIGASSKSPPMETLIK